MPFQPPSSICPICQKPGRFNFIRDHQDRDSKFSLYECSSCGIQFWTPFKGPGKEWYEENYDSEVRNILVSKAYKHNHMKFLKRFKNLPPNTRILDIGCGIGEFLAELQGMGCEVWGVDFNKGHTAIARNKFSLKNIYTMDFNDFFKKENLPQFDIVTFFGFLEHIDNPLGLVQKVKKILKPNGIIVTTAPSKDSLVKGLVYRDLPPNHLSQWNRGAISKLFQKIDFSISHLEHLDEFRSLKSFILQKFRLGLVAKTAKTFNSDGSKKHRTAILLKIIHILGDIKDYVIAGIPASFLWLISRLMKRKGGMMFVILKKS